MRGLNSGGSAGPLRDATHAATHRDFIVTELSVRRIRASSARTIRESRCTQSGSAQSRRQRGHAHGISVGRAAGGGHRRG